MSDESDGDGIDVEQIAIWELAAALRIEAECFTNEVWSAQDYLKLLENGGGAAFARVWGNPAGVLWWRDDSKGTIELISLGVFKKYRGQGVAMSLMDFCFDHANKYEFERMTLEARVSNPVLSWYKRLGFKETTRRRDYYPDHEAAVFMARSPPF